MTPTPRPLRVVVVTTSFKGGGAEFVAATWAGWLASQGHDVRIATTTIHDDGAPPENVRHVALRGRTTLGTIRSLRRALQQPADVVLALQTLPNLVALAATRGSNRPAMIASERNITTRENERIRPSDRIKRAIAMRWYRRADLTIAVSHSVAAELVSAYGIPGGRVVTVPNPAGHRAENRAANDGAAVARDDVLRLALPMRLVPQKRIGLAVEAAAVLRERGIDARLLCFGTKAGMAALAAHAEAAGVPIESPGWVPDWAGATPAGSVALLPSYREGFGNVLVEAAQAGIPSVAISNAYGVADALVSGVSGQLAFTGTADAVADAILAARELDFSRVPDWTRRFSTDESGRLLTTALHRAIAHRDNAVRHGGRRGAAVRTPTAEERSRPSEGARDAAAASPTSVEVAA